MAIKTSILASSRHLTYRVAYIDYTCLLHHNYYINLDVTRHFYIVGHDYCLSLHCAFSYFCVRYFPTPIFILCLYVGQITYFRGSTSSTFPTLKCLTSLFYAVTSTYDTHMWKNKFQFLYFWYIEVLVKFSNRCL